MACAMQMCFFCRQNFVVDIYRCIKKRCCFTDALQNKKYPCEMDIKVDDNVLDKHATLVLQKVADLIFSPWFESLKDEFLNAKRELHLAETWENIRTLHISSGKLARFADGTAVAKFGETSVLVAAVSKKNCSPSSFVPLTVDFRLKAAAAGRIPMNYMRREGALSEQEILTSRVIDRSLRPLFPPGYVNDTQVVCNVLASDGSNDPDIVSINAASAALSLSHIPWNGPVGAVRVGIVDKDVVINPTRRQLQSSSLDLIVTAAAKRKVVMLEGVADVVSLYDLERAVSTGVKHSQVIISSIAQLQQQFGKSKMAVDPTPKLEPDVVNLLCSVCSPKLRQIFYDDNHDKVNNPMLDVSAVLKAILFLKLFINVSPKVSRDESLQSIKKEIFEKLKDVYPNADARLINDQFNSTVKDIFRSLILNEERRCDGRSLTELRNIHCEIDLYESLHGSALFQRGQTQVLCTVTYDSPEAAIRMDPVSILTGGVKEKNFMLHYEFPPYAVNEVGRAGPVGRREFGHGALAEKGLKAVVPSNCPFTIRLTSEVLESNGSSSMASVCGGSLALMDAGVKISAPVAGVSIGLISSYDNDPNKITDYKILTDLLGIEDYLGDMDFKIAGTKNGITALQVDVKVPGIPLEIVDKALGQGYNAKNRIIDIMDRVMSKPRSTMKSCGPLIEDLHIKPQDRHKLFGVGGRNLRRLKSGTGVTVIFLDENKFQLFAPNADAMDEGRQMLEEFLKDDKEPELEFGAIYQGMITEIRDTGVLVELHPKLQPVLLHNSQLDQRKIQHPSALNLQVGQEISVKYFGRDPATGRMRISRKVLQSAMSRVMRSMITTSNSS